MPSEHAKNRAEKRERQIRKLKGMIGRKLEHGKTSPSLTFKQV